MILEYESTGLCPDCDVCANEQNLSLEDLNKGIEDGSVFDEGSFCSSPCFYCGTCLGGNRYAGHGRDTEGALVHFELCETCLMDGF